MAELLRADVGDLTFDVRAEGPEDGRPVLLLHGFPETSASWAAVTPLLTQAGLRTYAPDQLGYSPGARPDEVGVQVVEVVEDEIALCVRGHWTAGHGARR